MPSLHHVAAVFLLLLAGCANPAPDPAQDEPPPAGTPGISLQKIVGGLDRPVFVAEPAPGRLYIVEQAGRIKFWDGHEMLSILDISGKIKTGYEQGLLGLAFVPGKGETAFVVDYTDKEGDTVVALYEGTIGSESGPSTLAESRVLLRIDQPFSNHNGGMVGFGPDGMLYIGMGDGGSAGDPQNRAQDKHDLLGKLLRIDIEASATKPYSIPEDNPFAAGGGAPEVWDWGLRNPWRFSWDRMTGELWIGDVGQGEWEEIDRAANGTGGHNWGWNIYEGSHERRPGVRIEATPPLWEYNHDGGNQAVTGGYVYRGTAVPGLQGTYLYGDFGSGKVWGLKSGPAGVENSLLLDTTYSISSFGERLDGEILLLDYAGGTVYQVVAAPAARSQNHP